MKKGVKLIFPISKETVLIAMGIFVYAFGLKSFLIPNSFIDGGITGVSLILHFLSSVSVSVLIFALNIPFFFLGKKQVGNIFAIKTFIAITALSFVLSVVNFPIITSDKLLAAVFGGFMVGAGTGLSMRGGSVIDGTEVLSIYLNRKLGLAIGEIIFIINVIIFSFAALFLGIEAALYSILTYLIASKTIDFFVQGIEEYIGLTVISSKNNEIKSKLISLGKGVTIYKGKSGYSNEGKEIDILFTFVTRLEVLKIKQNILSVDPKAVIIEQGIREVSGGIIKRRPLHN